LNKLLGECVKKSLKTSSEGTKIIEEVRRTVLVLGGRIEGGRIDLQRPSESTTKEELRTSTIRKRETY